MALTNLDVLSAWPDIPICVAYRIGKHTTQEFPLTPALEKAEPIFERMPGWRTDITGATTYDELPKAAQQYVERLQDLITVPIRHISVGPHRA
jgi:adenylosuccinate synthase